MSKKADVWMPIYIGDYLADTAMLSTEQHGAYLLMLMAYWKNGPLPDDDEILANITRLPIDRWKKTRGLLLGFFSVIDGFLINRRADEEKEKADAFLAKQRSNGAKGGRPPKPKNPNETQNKPMGSVWLNPNETPSPSPIDTTTATSAGDGGADLDGQQVDKLPPITRGAGEPKILITTEWGPSDHFDTMATMAGIRMDDETRRQRIAEFVSYWLPRSEIKTQADWDHGLLQACIRWKNTNPATTFPPKPRHPAKSALHNFDGVDYSYGVNPDGSF